MKTPTRFLMMVASGLILVFTGCSKGGDDTGTPDNGKAAEQLKAAILGKWTFSGGFSFEAAASAGVSANRLTPQATKAALRAELRDVIAEAFPTGGAGGFIEFQADGTFLILDANGNFFTGDYLAKDGQTIDLSGFGSIKEIKFTEGRIDFLIVYRKSSQTLQVSANKAPAIPASERTTLICRTWELERAIAGWDDFEADFDKATVTFTSAGTMLFEFFKADGTLLFAEVENWSWHPRLSNRIFEWTIGEDGPPDDDEYTVHILQLTETRLEVASYDGNEVNTHLVFKAAN